MTDGWLLDVISKVDTIYDVYPNLLYPSIMQSPVAANFNSCARIFSANDTRISLRGRLIPVWNRSKSINSFRWCRNMRRKSPTRPPIRCFLELWRQKTKNKGWVWKSMRVKERSFKRANVVIEEGMHIYSWISLMPFTVVHSLSGHTYTNSIWIHLGEEGMHIYSWISLISFTVLTHIHKQHISSSWFTCYHCCLCLYFYHSRY